MTIRECSKTTCSEPAIATLTFVYADSTAVIGALSKDKEPHSYDLCADHAAHFTAPQGWTVIVAPTPLDQHDDLVALARATSREDENRAASSTAQRDDHTRKDSDTEVSRVRHLTVMTRRNPS